MKYFDRVSNIGLVLSVICGIALTTFVFLSAVMRYLAGSPFHFTEEIVGLLFVSMVFLTLPACNFFDRDIVIDLFRAPRRRPIRIAKKALSEAVIVMFYLIFGYQSYKFAHLSFVLQSRSEMGEILLHPWMFIIPAACILGILIRLGKLLLVMQQTK